MAFVIKTADAEKTFEARRQSILSLTQLFAQFGQQTVPLAMQLFGPAGLQMKAQAPDMWAFMARLLTGSCNLMEEVFKFFGEYNSKEFVPDLALIDKFLDTAQAIGATLGGAMAATGIPGQSGLGGQPGAAPGAVGGGLPLTPGAPTVPVAPIVNPQ
jgi:hypothetical protein